jgi:membrane protease YdiL (CAAX protease family)
MEQELSSAAVAMVGVAAVGSLGTWAIIGQRLRQHGEVVSSEPRTSVPWTWWHVLLVFLAATFLPSVAFPLNDLSEASFETMSPDKVANLLATMGVISLLAMLFGLAVIKLTTPAKLQDFGLSLRHSSRDFFIGSFGFMAATLPVLGVQFVVTQIVEYNHPILDMLNESANDRIWLVALFTAVVVAPLTEELLFRVLLQGWLEKVATRAQLPAVPSEAKVPDSVELGAAGVPVEIDPVNPYAATASAPAEEQLAPGSLVKPPVWPIWITTGIFALMHVGQGLAWVPLLLLGAILGYVYRQTHRLMPCVVLHALFNLFSLMIFRLSVHS